MPTSEFLSSKCRSCACLDWTPAISLALGLLLPRMKEGLSFMNSRSLSLRLPGPLSLATSNPNAFRPFLPDSLTATSGFNNRSSVDGAYQCAENISALKKERTLLREEDWEAL